MPLDESNKMFLCIFGDLNSFSLFSACFWKTKEKFLSLSSRLKIYVLHNPKKWTNEQTNVWVSNRETNQWTNKRANERTKKKACERTNERKNRRASEVTNERTSERASERANERTLGQRNERSLCRFPGMAVQLVANKLELWTDKVEFLLLLAVVHWLNNQCRVRIGWVTKKWWLTGRFTCGKKKLHHFSLWKKKWIKKCAILLFSNFDGRSIRVSLTLLPKNVLLPPSPKWPTVNTTTPKTTCVDTYASWRGLGQADPLHDKSVWLGHL